MKDLRAEVTIRRETVYTGKLIQVHRETVQLPQGGTTDREIVAHPEVVAMIPVLDDGRVVMVRQYRKAVDRVLLEVPAGGIDPGESAEDAVRREMIEETGYRVGQMTHIADFYSSPGFTTELMHLYKVTKLIAGTATEASDELQVVILDPREALRQVRAERSSDAKTLLALLHLGPR